LPSKTHPQLTGHQSAGHPLSGRQLSGLQASHLLDLSRHPGFKHLLAYLRSRQEVHLRQCHLLDPLANATELARRQGEIRALREFDDPAALISRVSDFLRDF
jgi:hypothetical protein